ncbi:hypothetical protein H8E88_17910 [candidate division KSB1 bacterium]|nr:hypothetical protein [candidate division KSB1 bacterium]MBL7094688.1 hypothetical protein [candidate division KSB1 bacterium]
MNLSEVETSAKEINQATILRRIHSLAREIEELKRDYLIFFSPQPKARKIKTTLFGSVRSGDITDEMIEDSKKSLFRPLTDI